MIYVMSQKFFVKHDKKLVAAARYFGIDGENISTTNRKSDQSAISTQYSFFFSAGSFTPDTRLYRMLVMKKKGEDVNPVKYAREVDFYFEDKSFAACTVMTLKALLVDGTTARNVFLVLPNVVYKFLGQDIIDHIREIADLPFELVLDQSAIKDDPSCLKRNLLSRRKLEMVKDRIPRIEEKYDLHYNSRYQYGSYDD